MSNVFWPPTSPSPAIHPFMHPSVGFHSSISTLWAFILWAPLLKKFLEEKHKYVDTNSYCSGSDIFFLKCQTQHNWRNVDLLNEIPTKWHNTITILFAQQLFRGDLSFVTLVFSVSQEKKTHGKIFFLVFQGLLHFPFYLTGRRQRDPEGDWGSYLSLDWCFSLRFLF